MLILYLSARMSGDIEPFRVFTESNWSPVNDPVSDVSIRLSMAVSESIDSSGGSTTIGVTYVLNSACIKKLGGF